MDATLWLTGATGALTVAAGTALLAPFVIRIWVRRAFAHVVRRLLTDPYDRNLLELFSVTRRAGLQTVLETSLRAEEGGPILRPFGSVRSFPRFESLLFNFAQLADFPVEPDQPVDFRTVIGPQAARPLVLELPILIAPMAYGLSLSAAVKVALAKGATLAGTAANTGEGPYLPDERAAARHLILQYGRGTWAKEPEILRQADAIEIQWGTGARGGVGSVMPAARFDARLRRLLGLETGEEAVAQAVQPGVTKAADLRTLVGRLRETAGGVPVGVKLAAGKDLERDLEFAVEAGADFLTVSGAEAGTWGSPPILEDDFGLPILYALSRAARYMERQELRGRVSLLVEGKLQTPGDFLKALALGADAVYIGSVALFALAHTQILKALPWEPPTQVLWYSGRRTPMFDVEQGAWSLARFLQSCRAEMAEGIRALGKTSHREVSRADLVALDPFTAEICGVESAYRSHGHRDRARWLRRSRRPKPLGQG